MSAAPRPYSIPPSITGVNGSVRQASVGPDGTTSVCPAKQNTGPSRPRFAQKLSTGPKRKFSTSNPTLSRRAAISGWHPASVGLTDAREIKSRVNSSKVDIRTAARGAGAAGSSTGRSRRAPPPQ